MVVTVLMLSCLCTSVFAAENCNKAVSENVSAELNCNGDNTLDAFYTNFYKNSNCKSLIPLENNVNAKISGCYYQSTPATLTFSLLKSENVSDEETDLLSSGSSIDTETTTQDGNNSEISSEMTTTDGENSDNASESTTSDGNNSDDATESTTTDGSSSDDATESTTTNGSNSDNATETTTEDEGKSSHSGGGGNSSRRAEKKDETPEKDDDSSTKPEVSTEIPEKDEPATPELPLDNDTDSNDNDKADDNNSDNSVNIPETDNILPPSEEDITVPVEVPADNEIADNVDTNIGTTLPQTGSPFGTVEITLLGLALIVAGTLLFNKKSLN